VAAADTVFIKALKSVSPDRLRVGLPSAGRPADRPARSFLRALKPQRQRGRKKAATKAVRHFARIEGNRRDPPPVTP
jgi:hypothetical protein